MRINRKKYNNYMYFFITAFIVISGFTDISILWHIIILILFSTTYLFYNRKNLRQIGRSTQIAVLLILTGIFFIASCIISPKYDALSSNLRSSLYSLCGIGLLYIINKSTDSLLYEKINKNILFFNLVLTVNIIVLFIQTKGTGFLIRSSWLAQNPYYEDHCAGLFGANSTNVLGLYSIFVMMLNLSYVTENKRHRKFIIGFTIISQSIMAYLSQFNDNMGYYVLLVSFLSIYAYIMLSTTKNYSKRIFSVVKYAVIIVAVFFAALNTPVLGDFIKKSFYDRVQRMFFYQNFGGAAGSSERLAIIKYGFTLNTTYAFGTGVGATRWIGDKSYGFSHFGINSMGSYLIIGGIWFFILYTLLYTEIYYKMFVFTRKENKIVLRAVIFLLVIIFTIYTTLFNDARTAILLGMIAIVFRPMIKTKQNVVSKESVKK